jgi:hypothetical protein
MRKYKKDRKLLQIRCNMCGKEILLEKEIIKEGVLNVQCDWGYFSSKDGERHTFDLCEHCYDKMTEAFVLPVEKENLTEMI